MFDVIRNSWAILFGILLLMIGNGLHGTLLGVRGDIEGFSTAELSVVMSAYFAGFLGGSQAAPWMIRRVGHIRSFAALGSMVSAALILFPVLVDPIAWTVLRAVIGFCLSAVYVTAESWLNNSTTNENRGKTLSIYMVVQLLGVVVAQGLLVLGDPAGFTLFIVLSVLVSVSFAPIVWGGALAWGADANRDLDVASVLDRHVFGDGSGTMGACLLAQQDQLGSPFAQCQVQCKQIRTQEEPA